MIKDLANIKFGKLQPLTYYRKNNRTYWTSKCECGNIKDILSSNLIRGLSKSCGCTTNKSLERHHLHGTKIYQSWRSMKSRCHAKPTENQYANYTERGIMYCDKWRKFEGFYSDMSVDYIEGYTIERKNVNKGYDRDNCIWIPKSEQNKNKVSTPRFNTVWGYITISEAVKFSGLSHATIIGRRIRGWNDEKIFSINKPLSKGQQKKAHT